MYCCSFFTKFPRIDPTRNFSKSMTLCIVFVRELSSWGVAVNDEALNKKVMALCTPPSLFCQTDRRLIPKRRRSRSSCRGAFFTVTLRWSAVDRLQKLRHSLADLMRVAVWLNGAALQYAGRHALSQAWRLYC